MAPANGSAQRDHPMARPNGTAQPDGPTAQSSLERPTRKKGAAPSPPTKRTAPRVHPAMQLTDSATPPANRATLQRQRRTIFAMMQACKIIAAFRRKSRAFASENPQRHAKSIGRTNTHTASQTQALSPASPPPCHETIGYFASHTSRRVTFPYPRYSFFSLLEPSRRITQARRRPAAPDTHSQRDGSGKSNPLVR